MLYNLPTRQFTNKHLETIHQQIYMQHMHTFKDSSQSNEYFFILDYLGGSSSRKILRFNTIVFRKDKWGIILKEIIRTSKIRVLWGLKVVPIGRNKGR